MAEEQAANLPRSDARLPPVRRVLLDTAASARRDVQRRSAWLGCRSGRRRSTQGLSSNDVEVYNGNRVRDLRGAIKDTREDGLLSEVAASDARGSPSIGVSAATWRVLGRGDSVGTERIG
ncbi:hypothetical protein HN51_004290 [Arachis hypogaea]